MEFFKSRSGGPGSHRRVEPNLTLTLSRTHRTHTGLDTCPDPQGNCCYCSSPVCPTVVNVACVCTAGLTATSAGGTRSGSNYTPSAMHYNEPFINPLPTTRSLNRSMSDARIASARVNNCASPHRCLRVNNCASPHTRAAECSGGLSSNVLSSRFTFCQDQSRGNAAARGRLSAQAEHSAAGTWKTRRWGAACRWFGVSRELAASSAMVQYIPTSYGYGLRGCRERHSLFFPASGV